MRNLILRNFDSVLRIQKTELKLFTGFIFNMNRLVIKNLYAHYFRRLARNCLLHIERLDQPT